MSFNTGADEYGAVPRRRWTTSARRGRGWDAVARLYNRSSSLRPATPGSPQSPADGGESGEDAAAAARRQTLQRMASPAAQHAVAEGAAPQWVHL